MSNEPESINALNVDLFQAEEVDRFGDPKEARKKAMDYLARREYGFEELVNKLGGAGFEAEVSADAVFALRADGLQSDHRFAESFVQSRLNQGKGPVRICQELKERGVSTQAIGEAMQNADADWFALAIEVREKKFGRQLPNDFKEKARQMRFLQYRGFDQDQIQQAVQNQSVC